MVIVMLRYVVIILLGIFLVWEIHAVSAFRFVQDRLKIFESFRESLIADSSKSNKKRVMSDANKVILDSIAIDEICQMSLGKYRKKISPKQYTNSCNIFRNIIVNRLRNANVPEDIGHTKEKYQPPTLKKELKIFDKIFKKDAIVVKSEYEFQDSLYFMDLYFFEKDKKVYVYDIHLDSSSLLLDFKNQFAKIIRDKGFKTLINKLKNQAQAKPLAISNSLENNTNNKKSRKQTKASQ